MKPPAWSLQALALVGLAAATGSVQRAGESAGSGGLPHRVAALPAIPFLEFVALGYRAAAADAAWLQAVQYYGEHRQGGNDLSEFRHDVAAVNTLDPRFEPAYVFGAFVLCTEQHDLPGALDLLRRGSRANPESPLCPFEMGFLTYVEGGDLDAALAYLKLSAQLPGGRDRAQRFMAFLNRKLGRLQTAWLLWDDIYRNSRDPGMRAVAAENMRRIAADLHPEKP